MRSALAARRRPGRDDPAEAASLRICIITSAIICDNPRVVKEADALAAAGHDVRVIAFAPRTPASQERDAATMKGRNWRLHTVPIGRSGARAAAHWVLAALVERFARLLFRVGVRSTPILDAAMSKYRGALYRHAVRSPADIVIAHHTPALPPAAHAARTLSARLAFDAEDLHAEDRPETPRHDLERRLISAIEQHYLPLCERITASSPGIADELVRRYGVPRPLVILNAFPIAERIAPRAQRRNEATLSLYWYSQVIGLDRGLQDVIRAMPLVGRPIALHLRGVVSPEARRALVALAVSHGVGDALHFWPPAPPPDLIALAAEHDIGLALEQPVTLNRKLCVTNKLLLYFTAGIPVVATDVPGQRQVIDEAGDAGALYPPGDSAGLAQAIQRLAATPETLAAAKEQALRVARERFSWELFAPRLVEYVAGGLHSAAGRSLPR